MSSLSLLISDGVDGTDSQPTEAGGPLFRRRMLSFDEQTTQQSGVAGDEGDGGAAGDGVDGRGRHSPPA